MPPHSIGCVNQLADKNNKNPTLDFLDWNGDPIKDYEFNDTTNHNSEIEGVDDIVPHKKKNLQEWKNIRSEKPQQHGRVPL